MIESWDVVFGSFAWQIVRWMYVVTSSTWFFYAWGWGDVSYTDDTTEDGDAAVAIGEPDDPWHRRRRYANRAVVAAIFAPTGKFWFDVGLLLALAIVAVSSRPAFRQGVWDGDYRSFRRWFGPDEKPMMPGGFRKL
jgi:hypothetical protein